MRYLQLILTAGASGQDASHNRFAAAMIGADTRRMLAQTGVPVSPAWSGSVKSRLALHIDVGPGKRRGVTAAYQWLQLINGRRLAEALAHETAAATGLPDRGTRPFLYRLGCSPLVAQVAIRWSLQESGLWLTQPGRTESVATGIAQGLTRFCRNHALLILDWAPPSRFGEPPEVNLLGMHEAEWNPGPNGSGTEPPMQEVITLSLERNDPEHQKEPELRLPKFPLVAVPETEDSEGVFTMEDDPATDELTAALASGGESATKEQPVLCFYGVPGTTPPDAVAAEAGFASLASERSHPSKSGPPATPLPPPDPPEGQTRAAAQTPPISLPRNEVKSMNTYRSFALTGSATGSKRRIAPVIRRTNEPGMIHLFHRPWFDGPAVSTATPASKGWPATSPSTESSYRIESTAPEINHREVIQQKHQEALPAATEGIVPERPLLRPSSGSSRPASRVGDEAQAMAHKDGPTFIWDEVAGQATATGSTSLETLLQKEENNLVRATAQTGEGDEGDTGPVSRPRASLEKRGASGQRTRPWPSVRVIQNGGHIIRYP